jgi:hypothetical protein
MAVTPSVKIREYRIMPELRRCCWYGLGGEGVVLGTVFLVDWFLANCGLPRDRPPGGLAVLVVFFALLGVATVLPLRWRLRLGPDGIARRWLGRWDSWTWADFASGRIEKRHRHRFRDPERPWWRRRLTLDYMASDDIRDVVDAVNAHYRLPPPPDVPERLTLKQGLRRKMVLDHQGIQIIVGDEPRVYLWSEVRHACMTRLDPMRRDFAKLLILLPDREIEWKLVTHQGGTTPTWRGATAEEINEMLFRHLAPEQIEVLGESELPEDRGHIVGKLKEAKRDRRDFHILTSVFIVVLAGCLLWMAVFESILKAAVMTALVGMFLGPVLVFFWRVDRRRVEKLERILEGLGGSEMNG